MTGLLPDWYTRYAATTGSAFVSTWTNADVVVVAFIAFSIFYVLAIAMTAEWPTDLAFLSLVAGGLLVAWPAMIVLSMAAVALVMVISILHSVLAPSRSVRIAAEAERQVAPVLERFARAAGLPDADRVRLLADQDAEPPPR